MRQAPRVALAIVSVLSPEQLAKSLALQLGYEFIDPTAASRWRAKCMRATRASFWAMILSVPCSSAMRRSETDGEKRTKLSRPSQETAKNF